MFIFTVLCTDFKTSSPFFIITGEVLGALCSMKGTGVFVACCDEILKNVGENLERRLPDPEEVAEGLMHKLTGSEKETGEEKVNN